MHEIGIASSILEAVECEARRRPDSRVIAVGVRIGELSCVDKDALEFAFEALTRETPLEHLKLEVQWCPRRQRCLACGEEYAVVDFRLDCPKCGGTRSTCVSGTELEIAYLELEEPCAKS